MTDHLCAHCGEPVTAPAISEWIGGTDAGTPRYWHADRPACRAASEPPEDAPMTDQTTEQRTADRARAQLAAARAEADATRKGIGNLRVQHERHRHALAYVLGLGSDAEWPAITERAAALDGRADSIRSTTEQFRRELADTLGTFDDMPWPDLIQRAREQHADLARCREEAEANARADVVAARQAEEQAGATLATRHRQLCDALGHAYTVPWPDVIASVRACVDDRVPRSALTRSENARDVMRKRLTAELDAAEAVAREAKKLLERRTGTLQTRAKAAEATLAAVRAELDRITNLPTVNRDEDSADRFSVGARWTVRLIRDALGEGPFEAPAEMGDDDAEQGCDHGCDTSRCPCLACDAERPAAAEHACPDHDQPADLAAYTAPVSPRELIPVGPDHVVHELNRALTDDNTLTDQAARDLIGRYYAAITSGPPANPAEQPQPIVVHLDMADRAMVKAIRKALRNGGTGGYR